MANSTLNKLVSSGIVAVVRKIDPDKVTPLVDSLVAGGVTGIEITMNSKNSLEKISELKSKYGEQTVVGAGTVLNQKQAKEAIVAGADFIFAPTLDRDTIEYTKREGKIMIPGAFTPTEIYQGYIWGADIIKVFPASVLGPKFIKDIKGPLGEIQVMPTGGISLNNIKSFFETGSIAVGVGGSLVQSELINQNKWEELEVLAKSFVESKLG
ncbi:bifunctional 4-hydroxy-2-oxoglutarate aldolase/2-dehydro-3-deoxy-phosphogluconate aldolase [Virgibacillus dakarensis]|uniref:2-dehydro-3-deoxy-phosphogluconate aldolase n=1 Tax=Lentibacillus populi TaxID=1827502 RepID=A0A9W5TUY3_9BACI|nr:bifunctional 4-hydroxy-2-oxoglutarate aldolase/2-dehydro-3-deoxy-phosphogluconate aldolase [Lentibacillus populi]MTW87198.1 bifunctional 4-hydroxy-2-oxoglutarate aldolase/2-dehydro-3-deoxy-phosphogluconate aldolase [Virgibacillus dakarensis]GGB31946.1 2-dehydro-3-deoxy-phosphogluconate aldolase [Lentibacillus populi]